MKILVYFMLMLMATQVKAAAQGPYSLKESLYKALSVAEQLTHAIKGNRYPWSNSVTPEQLMDAIKGNRYPWSNSVIPGCKDDVNTAHRCLGKPIGRDCSDLLRKHKSATDGIYTINPGDGKGSFRVFCDMTTDGGGWTVFQRRSDGSENFYRTWDEYKKGFGHLSFRREFYLGNENIHRLTSKGPTVLRIDLQDFAHKKAYATYKHFMLGSATSNYKLHIGAYAGNAGDSLSLHNGMGFTTKDKDVDSYRKGNCAHLYHGAWWYKKCHTSNLNGKYNGKGAVGVIWYHWKSKYESLFRTEMKLRPQS